MRTFGTVKRATDGSWLIDCEPHVMIRLKRLFGKVAKTQKGAAMLSDTPENGRELAWFVQRFPMVVDDAAYLSAREKQHKDLGDQIAQVMMGDYVPRSFDLAVPPRDYQRVAADLALRTGRLLVGDDVGLGKTATAICALSDPSVRPALVVTLTHLPRQWQAEFQKFLPSAAVHIVKKGTPYKLDPLPDVLLINYHKLAGWQEALAGKMRAVVFDECQELRRADSHKWDAAKAIAFSAKLCMGLSATPIYNYAGEIHSILEVLATNALGTWAEFSREWCNTDWVQDKYKAPVKNPKALGTYLREQGLMLRRTRKDVGRELPPLTTVPHTIDADLDEIEKVAGSATELARVILRQGGMGAEKMRAAEELSWRLRQATGIAKAPFVADFVRLLVENGESVVLYGWHHEVYAIWKERLADLHPVFYTGAESISQKEAAKGVFVSGVRKVLIMSLRSGAGVDGLQGAARTVVFGELDWSPGVHEQCIGRIYRDGQAEPVCAYYLIADTGSDPVVADVLGVKASQSEGIRDPNAALIERSQSDPERVKRLAEAFLKQRGEKVPSVQLDMKGAA